MAATRSRNTGVLARGGKVLARVAASLPLPAQSTRLPCEPVLVRHLGPEGGGRQGPRASDSSSPTPFSRALQVSGLWIWALWEGAQRHHLGNPALPRASPSPCRSPKLPEGGLWTHSQRSAAVGGAAAPPRGITRLAPPRTRGQWSRPRKRSARPRLPAPRVTQQMYSAPIPEGRLFISHQATGAAGYPGTCSLR